MSLKRALMTAVAVLALVLLVTGCGQRQTQVQEVVPTAPAAKQAPAQQPAAPAQQQPAAPAQQQPAAPAAAADPARLIRKIVFLSNVQAQDPQEFELSRLVAEDFKKLGLDVEHRAIPWEQQSTVVWNTRDKWDMTSWRMVGRPERLDPDEFIFNLYHSSTATDGYNFIGYNNPEYDKLAEAQRSATDPAKRQEIIRQAQDILAKDQPYGFYVNPRVAFTYNNQVWDANSIVEAKGIGIKNFWTFVKATPKGNQKDMVLNSFDTVRAINPLYISGGVDSWVTELIWDRLMRIDENGLAKPWAAEKIDWKDETTVDVTLRSGMKWHDGKPVTVEDVVFSFMAPVGDSSPMYKPFVSRIDKVEATGGNVVRFKLKSAYVPFESSSLAKVNLIPKHIWEPILADLKAKGVNAETYQEEKPIGSGPFKYVSWQKAEQVVLEANKDHWAAPKMNRWVLRFIANVEAVLGQITSGELNFLSEYRGDYTVLEGRVKGDPKLTLVTTIEVGMRFLGYNHRRAPFNDPAFRRALSHAINRDAIVKQVYKGFAVVADSPISQALDFWRPQKLDAPTYDIDKAKAILKEAGYESDPQGKLMYPKGKTENTPPAQ